LAERRVAVQLTQDTRRNGTLDEDDFQRELLGLPRKRDDWRFPTRAATYRALQLQRGVRSDEQEQLSLEFLDFADERKVGQATIHTREDLVMLLSWQIDIHRQLVIVSRGVWVVALITALWTVWEVARLI
jgi:hypothetical protein